MTTNPHQHPVGSHPLILSPTLPAQRTATIPVVHHSTAPVVHFAAALDILRKFTALPCVFHLGFGLVLWYSRGPAFPPELGRVVGYLTEVKAGRGPWFARIWVGVVPGFPGVTCFGVGVVWASGAWGLAGNGVVAALGRGTGSRGRCRDRLWCLRSLCLLCRWTGRRCCGFRGGWDRRHRSSWGRGLFPTGQQGRENHQGCPQRQLQHP